MNPPNLRLLLWVLLGFLFLGFFRWGFWGFFRLVVWGGLQERGGCICAITYNWVRGRQLKGRTQHHYRQRG